MAAGKQRLHVHPEATLQVARSGKARVIEGTYRAFWQLYLHVNWASEDAAFLQSNTDSNSRIT